MERKRFSRFVVQKKEIKISVENRNDSEYPCCPYKGENCGDNHQCIYGIFDEIRKSDLN